ncbi:MAG: hypothetical protein WCI76_00830 [bacterium]
MNEAGLKIQEGNELSIKFIKERIAKELAKKISILANVVENPLEEGSTQEVRDKHHGEVALLEIEIEQLKNNPLAYFEEKFQKETSKLSKIRESYASGTGILFIELYKHELEGLSLLRKIIKKLGEVAKSNSEVVETSESVTTSSTPKVPQKGLKELWGFMNNESERMEGAVRDVWDGLRIKGAEAIKRILPRREKEETTPTSAPPLPTPPAPTVTPVAEATPKEPRPKSKKPEANKDKLKAEQEVPEKRKEESREERLQALKEQLQKSMK